MYSMRKLCLLFVLLASSCYTAWAQKTDSVAAPTNFKIRVVEPSTTDTLAIETPTLAAINDTIPLLDFEVDLKDQLLPLDSLIALAIVYSPVVKFEESTVQKSTSELKITKREWLKNVYGSTSYFIGNQNNVAYSADPITNESSILINGYRSGATINIPLVDIFTRKAKVSASRSEMESRIHKREVAEMEVAKETIILYNSLLSSFNVLKVLSKAMAISNTNYQLAEKEFRESAITIVELSSISETNFTAQTRFEYAKSQFFTYYTQLETLIGLKMSQMTRK